MKQRLVQYGFIIQIIIFPLSSYTFKPEFADELDEIDELDELDELDRTTEMFYLVYKFKID